MCFFLKKSGLNKRTRIEHDM